MGLLDDAIREHLELKRRRGADPSEIERAERDALGPVRRVPEPIQEGGFEPDPGLSAESGLERHGAEEHWDEHWPEESISATAPEPLAEPLEPLEPAGSQQDPAPVREPAPEPLPERAPDPAPDLGHASEEHLPRHDPEDHLLQRTQEYAFPGEEEGEKHGDEMLEETPEFLQDTPDHDRLWFEQRPPRDFDFDS